MKGKYEKMMILVVVLAMCLTTAVTNAKLVAHWELDDSDGSTIRDSEGENDGTIHGNATWVEGHFGGAIEFHGGNDYVNCGGGRKVGDSNTWADITDAITIAAWVKVTAFDKQWQSIITKGDSAWRLHRHETTNYINFACTGLSGGNKPFGSTVWGSTPVNDGQWHHVAGIYNGSKLFLYVDGNLDGPDALISSSGKIGTSNHDVYIGENSQRTGRQFNGLVDDVVVFNNALSEDEVKQLFNHGGASFIPKGYMAKLVEETETAVKELEPQEAIAFIEKKITEYEKWKATNLNDIELHDRHLSSDIYFLLAKTKEAAGVPKHDVIAAYKQSVLQVLRQTNYVPAALLWLFENMPSEEYVNIVKQYVYNTNVLSYNTYYIAKHFESSENWAAFEHFLDGLFSGVDFREQPTYAYAEVVAKALEKDGTWSGKFLEYCRSKPQIMEYLFRKHERVASRYMVLKDFGKAAKIYRDILDECGPNQEKAIYQFKLCECLFNDGQYDSAVHELDNFIRNNKTTHRLLIIKAIMLKGRAYIHLGDINQTIDTFFVLLLEYPEVKQGPEANFFIGYCYMLQGKFDEATETFNLVVWDYPESSYVSKARSCLARIKSIIEEE